MRPTRQTQPYRKGSRVPGSALTAMLRGRTAGGMNPADTSRAAYHLANAFKRKAARKQRTGRGPRAPR